MAKRLTTQALIRRALTDLVKRAKAYAKRTNRTLGGVSKELFDDDRTLRMLAAGHVKIGIARVLEAADRLDQLQPQGPRPRRSAGGSTRGTEKRQ